MNSPLLHQILRELLGLPDAATIPFEIQVLAEHDPQAAIEHAWGTCTNPNALAFSLELVRDDVGEEKAGRILSGASWKLMFASPARLATIHRENVAVADLLPPAQRAIAILLDLPSILEPLPFDVAIRIEADGLQAVFAEAWAACEDPAQIYTALLPFDYTQKERRDALREINMMPDRQKAEEMGLWKQVQIRACQRIRERVPCPILRDASGRLPRSLTR